MRALSGAVLVLVMALGAGGIGCSDGDSGVSSQLAAFEASIAEAQAAADSASAAAASAQGTADSASAAAASAQGAADSASIAASSAQSAASNAQGTATSAQNTANLAQDAASSNQGAIMALEDLTPRFVACADGLTIADTETGLVWERKTGVDSADVICNAVPGGCVDTHDVNNRYQWSSTGTAADGDAYTDFLAELNDVPGFAGRTDWRLPEISELQSILIGGGVLTTTAADPLAGANPTAQATICTFGVNDPCFDPDFGSIPGSSSSSYYWSASTSTSNESYAWNALLTDGTIFNSNPKSFDSHVRAVRTGSCAP